MPHSSLDTKLGRDRNDPPPHQSHLLTKQIMKPPKNIDISIIPPPSATDLANDIIKTVTPEMANPAGESESQSAEVSTLSRALIAIANQSWRITNAVIDQDSKEPKEELSSREIKKMNRALESMGETLAGLGINLIDRLGETFNTGLPDQVITEELTDGISKEQIIRTIRPTIMWHQTMVQRGEIDIAIPTTTATK